MVDERPMASEPDDPIPAPDHEGGAAGEPEPTGSTGRAVLFGGLAAAGAGAVWALIVVFTGLEIGWVAWGVGLAVGVVMARATSERSRAVGVRAAVLAAAGLVLGKLLIVEIAGPGEIAKGIQQDSMGVHNAVLASMLANGELSEELTRRYDSVPEGERLPDDLIEAMEAAATERMQRLDDRGRDSVARDFAKRILADVGTVERLKATLTPFDALWFLLAIGSAWKLTTAKAGAEGAATGEGASPSG